MISYYIFFKIRIWYCSRIGFWMSELYIGTCEMAVKWVIYHIFYETGLAHIMIHMVKLPGKTNAFYTCYILSKSTQKNHKRTKNTAFVWNKMSLGHWSWSEVEKIHESLNYHGQKFNMILFSIVVRGSAYMLWWCIFEICTKARSIPWSKYDGIVNSTHIVHCDAIKSRNNYEMIFLVC